MDRSVALRAFLVCGFALTCSVALAQSNVFPSKPVRVINPYAPGGAVDLVARSVGHKLNERWGQPVIVDNRPGAGTNIGTELVVRAAPDGYTLLFTSAVIATNVTLYRNLPFSPTRDLAPVALVAQSPFVLAVHPSLPVKNVSELIRLAKADGKMTFGSAGAGTTTHLMLELFKSMAKVDLLHVAYKGGGPAINAVISGEVQTTFLPLTVVLPQARAGKVRALGVTSAKRVELASDLPSITESGLPGFDPIGWYALFAPAATPGALIARINQSVNQALQQRDLKDRLVGSGMVPFTGSPEALRDHLQSEILRWEKVIKQAGIRGD